MDVFRNIALFIAANLIGFFGVSLTYHLSIALGLFTLKNEMLDNGTLQQKFFMDTTYVWMVCAVLSLGFFIFREKGRKLFLLLPVILPAAYGFSVLIRLGGAV